MSCPYKKIEVPLEWGNLNDRTDSVVVIWWAKAHPTSGFHLALCRAGLGPPTQLSHFFETREKSRSWLSSGWHGFL